ncbi:hypothetical protein L1987_34010 [Smallanthus sonchifolius]|uniref:Uncharacterized protein n=1 Tax=Smallanthus sonchifolius TaxID=185202 RepID=A0ACB9HV85_9ASTR|nr:hypothetical protein L1987_34010 [Smallanthus sonchifolius]
MVGFLSLNQCCGESLATGIMMVKVLPVTTVGAKVHLETLRVGRVERTASELFSWRRVFRRRSRSRVFGEGEGPGLSLHWNDAGPEGKTQRRQERRWAEAFNRRREGRNDAGDA